MATKDPIILDSTGQEILTAIKDLKSSSNNYKELSNKPAINSTELNGTLTLDDIGAQEKLVPAQNIKTINGVSILGTGNIAIAEGSATWGLISGVLQDQSDLQSVLDSIDSDITDLKTKSISVEDEVVIVKW